MTSVERVRNLLQQIAVELEGQCGNDLWCILTALRGPDDDADGSLKTCTTAVIRHRALGDSPHLIGAIVAVDTESLADNRAQFLYGQRMQHCAEHFRSHIRAAFDALERLEL